MIQDRSDYRDRVTSWHTARCLYYGGESMKRNAELFLSRRQKEPLEVYRERIASAYYENYIGSIIDWYVSAAFRREPVVFTHEAGDRAKRIVSRFLDNCDQRGTSLTDLFRTVVRDAMVFGEAHLIVDFPAPEGGVEGRALGVDSDQTYLVNCAPEQIVDWGVDELGVPEYAKVAVRTQRASGQAGSGERGDRFYEYTREGMRIVDVHTDGSGNVRTEVAREGPHCLSRHGMLPIVKLETPPGLWMMERAGNVQVEHFNKANALSWALSMGLYATPVVYSDREWNQIAGESYFIQLSPGDKFGWTEPEGKVYQIASQNLERLKMEIFRVCHLSGQGGASGNTIQQSGLSKQRDFQVTQEMLRALGAWVKKGMKRVLEHVLRAWDESAVVIVSGMDQFDIGEFTSELSDAERLLALRIGSRTLEKQIHKKLALQFLSDMRQEVKDAIVKEIENS